MTATETVTCEVCSSTEHTGRFGCPNDPAIIETADDRVKAVLAAKAEYTAWKNWNSNGRVGPEPICSNLEAIRNTPTTTKKEKNMSKSSTPKVSVRYYRDGEPKADRYNTFGRLGRRDGYSTKSMLAYLAEQGITEPTSSTWFHKLPSGVVIGAVVEGDEVPAGILVKSSKLDRTIGRAAKSIEATSGKKSTKPVKAEAIAATFSVVQHGKQSFAVVNGDGEQIGKRVPSRKRAEAVIAAL